jgi:hypothetical protein
MQQEHRQQPEEPRQTPPKQQLQHEDKRQTKLQPLQQQEEETMEYPLKQQMQHIQQPLQQEEEPRQSPLQNGNQAKKPLSKDEVLNYIIGT